MSSTSIGRTIYLSDEARVFAGKAGVRDGPSEPVLSLLTHEAEKQQIIWQSDDRNISRLANGGPKFGNIAPCSRAAPAHRSRSSLKEGQSRRQTS